MQDLGLEGKDIYLRSYDISSLFTKVPLKETIGICAEALYKDLAPYLPSFKRYLLNLMKVLCHSLS